MPPLLAAARSWMSALSQRSAIRAPSSDSPNIDRGWELMAPLAGAPVTVPALYMAGERDFVAAVFSRDIATQSALR